MFRYLGRYITPETGAIVRSASALPVSDSSTSPSQETYIRAKVLFHLPYKGVWSTYAVPISIDPDAGNSLARTQWSQDRVRPRRITYNLRQFVNARLIDVYNSKSSSVNDDHIIQTRWQVASVCPSARQVDRESCLHTS